LQGAKPLNKISETKAMALLQVDQYFYDVLIVNCHWSLHFGVESSDSLADFSCDASNYIIAEFQFCVVKRGSSAFCEEFVQLCDLSFDY
jgi:hypothetical protein